MAGGAEKRLGNITKSTPKPAVKINKVPYIIYLLNWLKKMVSKKFYFLVSFKKDKLKQIIENYFKENKNLKFKILIEKRRRGTYGALTEHIKKLDDIFFYTNADEIGRFNIKDMYRNFLRTKTDIMSCVIKTRKGNFSLDRKKGYNS